MTTPPTRIIKKQVAITPARDIIPTADAELIRRFLELRRSFLAFEAFLRTRGIVLK